MQVELFSNQEELFDISMFEIDQEKQMVNLTKIAKALGKNVGDWTRNSQTQGFLRVLQQKYPDMQILMSIRGGNGDQGTWVHRKVAIKFAAWISPEFEVWTVDMLDELFQTGTVSLNPVKLPTYPELLRQHADLVEAHEKIVEEVKVIQPKAEYTDKVLTSISYFTTTQVAKELELTANALNKKLQDLGIHYKVSGQWVLKKNYQNLGYVETKTTPYYDSNQNLCTNHLTVWTEKGRNFIHNLLNPQLNNSLTIN